MYLEENQHHFISVPVTRRRRCFFFAKKSIFVGFGRKDVVEYLLSQNANVHIKDDGGLIPLHNAASFGHAEVVQLLINHHSNVNALDNWNFSPLAEAASKGKVDVCLSM